MLKLQNEQAVCLRKEWHKVLRNSIQRERHGQLIWKAININFTRNVLIRGFIIVASAKTSTPQQL